MWVKVDGEDKWINVAQIDYLYTVSDGSVSAAVGGTTIDLRDFATQTEADEWVADLLKNVRED